MLVRNHPLTRGWTSDLYRPLARFFDYDTAINVFQTPGGGIGTEDNNRREYLQLMNHNVLATLLESIQGQQQIALTGGLRELHEEAGISIDPTIIGEGAAVKFLGQQLVDDSDSATKPKVNVNIFHFHLGRLAEEQVVRMMKMGRTGVVK